DPGDDLISALAHAELEGQRLSDEEIGAFFGLFGAAGADTSRAAIGWTMEALSMFDDQKRLWIEDLEGRAKRAVDECLRWAVPTMHMRRTATRDVEIGGQTIRGGDKVALWWISGNRDAGKFTDPHRFDIMRAPNPMVSFGLAGPHFCVGAHLARLELKVTFTELLKRFPTMRATGPARRLRSNFI
ncbi:MAG: cytochrome P450, partial [Halioglobus sp.]|nr:cytochrome P450 [Halioglobus sp.]